MKLSIVLIFVLLSTAQVADAVDCYVGTEDDLKMVHGAHHCHYEIDAITGKQFAYAVMELVDAPAVPKANSHADTDGPEADGSWEDASQ